MKFGFSVPVRGHGQTFYIRLGLRSSTAHHPAPTLWKEQILMTSLEHEKPYHRRKYKHVHK